MELNKIGFIKELRWMLTMLDENPYVTFFEINWESGRGGGKNVASIIAQAIWAADPTKTFNFAVFRKQYNGIKELWNDYEEFLPYSWMPIRRTQEAKLNGNMITFNYLYNSLAISTNTLGKSMTTARDYMVIFMDESTQISNEDREKIMQAYARFGTKTIVIKTWNPWSPYNEIVKYMADVMPYPGIEYMKKHRIQMKIVDGTELVRGVELKTKKWFIRSTAYFNPFSTNSHILQLEAINKYNPDEGDTILYCKPGVVDGAVYKGIEKSFKTQEEIDKANLTYNNIVIGVDFGISDATSASVIGLTSKNHGIIDGVILLDEYYHKNKRDQKRKDINDYIIDILQFIADMYIKYNIDQSPSQVLNVYVDYANQTSKEVSFVDMLSQAIKEANIWNIKIHKASKSPIRDRILLTKYLYATDRLIFNKDTAPNHVKEFANSIYDISKILPDGFHPRIDNDDHCINSFEYALESVKNKLHKPDYE